MNEHILWGSLLFAIILLGAERLSIDSKLKIS